MSDSPPPSLEYVPRQSARKGIKTKDVVIVTLFVIALALAWNWKHLQNAWLVMDSYYWQQRCMNENRLPTEISYTDDPAQIARLKNDSSYNLLTPQGPAQYRDEALDQFLNVTAIRPNKQADEFAYFFVHDRTASNGDRRLIMAHLLVEQFGMQHGRNLHFMYEVIKPGGLTQTWDPAKNVFIYQFLLQLNPDQRFTLFAGQIDPKDTSKFTIAYSLDDSPGIIDGQLLDGGEVTLTPRTGTMRHPLSGADRQKYGIWNPNG